MHHLFRESAAALRRAQRRMKRFAAGTHGESRRAALANGEVFGIQGECGFQDELLALQGINPAGWSGKVPESEAAVGGPTRAKGNGLRLEQFAHDLDNLLMVIANRAELVELDLAELDLAELDLAELDHAGSDSGGAKSSANSIRAIQSAVQQALELSRLLRVADSQLVVGKEPVDLAEAARHAVNHAQTWLPRNIVLVEDLPVRPQVWIFGNLTQLQRVIRNVLTNAVHALRKGGRIVVSLDLVGGGAGRCARLQICDNGPGMDGKTRDRIFEPGFSGREGGNGHGLGMTIVSDIVRDHGGTISLESAPGCGTQIGILFPLVRSSKASSDQ